MSSRALIVSHNADHCVRFSVLAERAGWKATTASSAAEARALLADIVFEVKVVVVDELLPEFDSGERKPSGGPFCLELYDRHHINSVLLLEPARLESEADRSRDGDRVAELQRTFKFHDYFYLTSNENLFVSSLAKILSDLQHTKPLTWSDRIKRQGAIFVDDFPGKIEQAAQSLSCNPEKLYDSKKNAVTFHGETLIRDNAELPRLGVVFHSLSPCGDGFSFIASLGKDLAIATTLRIACIRYCIQGPNWAKKNHTISRILAADSAHSLLAQLARQRVTFLRRFDKRIEEKGTKDKKDLLETVPIVDPRVVDIEQSEVADELSYVEPYVKSASELVVKVFPEGILPNRSEATRILDKWEKDVQNKKVAPRSAVSIAEEVTMLKSLKGALAVSPTLDNRTLSYFFAQNAYLNTLGCSVVRLGPTLERNWDAAFEAAIKQDGYRKYSAVYVGQYELAAGWGLPYSFVSGDTMLTAERGLLDREALMFLGDGVRKIESILNGAPEYEARRFVADIINFVQCGSLLDSELVPILDLLPRDWFSPEGFMPAGSNRCVGWAKKALQIGNRRVSDTSCPGFLVPYLLTDNEWRQGISGFAGFLAAVGNYAAKYLPGFNEELFEVALKGKLTGSSRAD
jgi:hypothetical protein